MKRLVFTLLFVLATVCSSFAQFVVTPNGLEKNEVDGNEYYVIEVPGISQSELYTRTLQFITQTYVSPKDVISSKIENETISVTGRQTIFYDFNVLYKLVFRFKDGRVRFDIPQIISMKKYDDGKEYELTFNKARTQGQNIYIFNNKGELRGMAIPNYKYDIENLFNSLFNSYTASIMNKTENDNDDNW